MQVKIQFSYFEDVVPPRCRKARSIRFDDGEATIEIKEVSSQEAPVAIRANGSFIHRRNEAYMLEYRWWDSSLWSSVRFAGVEPNGRTSGKDDWNFPAWPSVLDLRDDYAYVDSYEFAIRCSAHEGRQHIQEYLQEMAKSHILIDGVAYRPAGEPRYVVMTFGLGQNHGGSACMMADSYNSNIAKNRYFSLLDREKAIALATDIATKRGDSQNLPIKPHGPQWEILLPEAIQVNPSVDHGDGCPLLNTFDAVSQATGGSPLAGFAVAAAATAGHI